MSRTEKRLPSAWSSKESKENRKRLIRIRRRAAKAAVKAGDYDRVPTKEPGTEGWMTW